jgi:4-carboxymuconolactone decarboxylase
VICTAAVERDCGFEWDSHSPIALAAGVSEVTLEAIRTGGAVDGDDAMLVDFTRELCREGRVGDSNFARVRDRLGEEGAVELSAIIGYYTMLAVFMNAVEAC